MVSIIDWGKFEKQDVELYVLENECLTLSVSTYGGIITSLKTKNKHGQMQDVVLGFPKIDDYLSRTYKKLNPHFGGIIGRFANRIRNGQFVINGAHYQLDTNENGINHIHGGLKGFDANLWCPEIPGFSAPKLKLNRTSKAGEEKYPGNLNVSVEYELHNNEIHISYRATTDQETPVNLTNHSYFNFNNLEQEIYDHQLQIEADNMLEVDENQIPTGKLLDVTNTAFDFRTLRPIKNSNSFGGFDNSYVLNNQNGRPNAILFEENSGIKLSVYTTQPSLQLYTANFLNGTLENEAGKPMMQHAAVCLEDQLFPNAPNNHTASNAILKPNQIYQQKTVWKFEVVE